MQTIASREVQNRYGEFIESVQDDVVCVTRHGRPLFWAVSDRHMRTSDPSVFIGRMLLLRGQLERQTNATRESFDQTLERLDATITPGELTEEAVTDIVHANRI